MDTVKQVKALIEKIKKAPNESLAKKAMKIIGIETIEIIRIRTRLGFGVPETGGKKKSLKAMKPHSKKYQEFRKENADKLSSETAPTKQNLTLTGSMLEDMVAIPEEKKVVIAFGQEENEQKAIAQTEAGRKFLDLTSAEIKMLERIIEKNLTNNLRKVRASK